MIAKVIFFVLALCFVSSNRVEIYEDWRPDAVGSAIFESARTGELYGEIRDALKEKGYSVSCWDRLGHLPQLTSWRFAASKEVLDPDTSCLVLSGIGLYLRDLHLHRIPKEKLLLFLFEPPTVQPEAWDPKVWDCFGRIYTWHDDLVDGVRFFKFHFPCMTQRIDRLIPYEERKFLTLIASRLSSKHPNELYSEREKLIRFFEAHPEESFDLYGRHWAKRKFRCWKGEIPAPDKMKVLKQYRFAIAYENSFERGYVTEKLWDCFAVGVVPIYWGAPNIAEMIPADCFIDRRQFQSDEELVQFLKGISEEEWAGYVERAGRFLQSEDASHYTFNSYAKTLAQAVSTPRGDSDLSLPFVKISDHLKSSDIDMEGRSALAQPFSYLGKGRQAFAFASEDGKWVIKFFNQTYIQTPFYAALFPKERAKRELRERFAKESYPIAASELAEETGIVYLHLGRCQTPLPSIEINHKKIDLNRYSFVLQKKVEPFYSSNMSSKEKIEQFLSLVAKRIEKKIADADHDVEHNFGVKEGKVIHLDPGRLYFEPNLFEQKRLTQEWWSATHRFRKWIEKEHPDELALFDQTMEEKQQ